jgi:putative peptidoglycan lipid II flippase
VSLRGPRTQVTAGNLAARITGLIRVVAVGGALGTTYLGNTYQSANLVSNLLFELLAAGILSSVLVPPFVALLDDGRREEAERLAGAVLGMALAVLGVVTLAGLVARPWIMRVLTVGVADDAVRDAEVRLGGFLLWLFVPQVLFYAVNSVSVAVLHGSRRFAAAAFAPVANNVMVIVTMVAFRLLAGTDNGLELPLSHRLLLAVGTTAGVVAMALVPLVALRRAGVRLRPRWAPSHPALRSLGRAGMWGAVYLTMSQVLVAVTLVLANRVEGGVVAYHIAFATFLLPFAVLAQPVLTTVYPRLAADGNAGRWPGFAEQLGRATRSAAFLILPASALMLALARPGLRVIELGALDDAGSRLVAHVLAAYALGLAGYTGLQLLTRASYALSDTRTPALVNIAVAVIGSVLMLVLTASAATGNGRMVAIGAAYSVAMVGGAVALGLIVRSRVGAPWPVGATLARSAAGAVAAGVAARLVADLVPVDGRLGAGLSVALGGGAGVGAYLLCAWALRAPELNFRRVAVAGRVL